MKTKFKKIIISLLMACAFLSNAVPAHAINISSMTNQWKYEVMMAKKEIPSRLKDSSGNVDVDKFDQKVKGRQAYKEKGGWEIERDNGKGTSHGGSYWKLRSPNQVGSSDRTATLDKNGKILRK